MSSNNPAAICIRDMASQCGLSRQRFMQLVKAGVFPAPLYDVETKRPFYSEELQAPMPGGSEKGTSASTEKWSCSMPVAQVPRRPHRGRRSHRASPPVSGPLRQDIADGLKALGLVAVSTTQVAEVVGQLFPQGTEKVEPGEVIRAVFVHLHRKNS